MLKRQEVEVVDRKDLYERVSEKVAEGYRLVAISCTSLPEVFQVDYSFDKNYMLCTMRVSVPRSDPVIKSISRSVFAACLYENEIHDLFGVQFTGMQISFDGKFYRIKKEYPFSEA